MNPTIFREYDIRGLADRDLGEADVERLGRAFGTYAQEKGVFRCVVGRDVRLSGPRIREALCRGILATGMDIIDIGIVPTPAFYYSFFHLDADAGMMVTASHNPPPENGIKVGLGKTTIYGDEIQHLWRLTESGRFRTGRGRLEQVDIIPEYVAMLRSKVTIPRELRVVFDPGNGTAGLLLEQLFEGTLVRPTFINLTPDGNFPAHVPDPTVPEYMRQVTELVRSTGADCGIGYDGDSDRIGAIDETGQMVYGDRLLGIYATEIVARRPGAPVVFDVKCSQGLIEYLRSIGARPLMWKTGHSLIKAKMKEEGAPVSGEMSGHMFFADDYYGYDDAVYASLRLLRFIAESRRPLSQLAGLLPVYHSTPEIRVPIDGDDADALKFRIVSELRQSFSGETEVIDIDGARVVFPDGWGLIRASNTQPILVLRFEARTAQRMQAIQELFYGRLRRFPQVRLPDGAAS